MSLKESFTAEEWNRVVGAPMLAGIAVTAADPGGLWGAVKESAATAGAITKAGDAGLIGEIAAAYKTSEGRDMARGALKAEVKGKKPAEIVDAALAELADVAGLVASRDAEAGESFRSWIREIAATVAEAGTEGGFLGFGGEKISEAERATLERLNSALA